MVQLLDAYLFQVLQDGLPGAVEDVVGAQGGCHAGVVADAFHQLKLCSLHDSSRVIGCWEGSMGLRVNGP